MEGYIQVKNILNRQQLSGCKINRTIVTCIIDQGNTMASMHDTVDHGNTMAYVHSTCIIYQGNVRAYIHHRSKKHYGLHRWLIRSHGDFTATSRLRDSERPVVGNVFAWEVTNAMAYMHHRSKICYGDTKADNYYYRSKKHYGIHTCIHNRSKKH